MELNYPEKLTHGKDYQWLKYIKVRPLVIGGTWLVMGGKVGWAQHLVGGRTHLLVWDTSGGRGDTGGGLSGTQLVAMKCKVLC